MNRENINFFQYLASVYDNMTEDVSFEQWGNYLTSFINIKNPNILEYACGTGNITNELTKKSDNIIAVDISREMLANAEKKLRYNNSRIQLVRCDMVDFILNKPVDCAVCACDGVNYITSSKDLETFFANVSGNLNCDGIFLFDISSEYKLINILGNEFYFTDDENETLLWQNTYFKEKSLVKMELTLFLKSGDVYNRYDEVHFQRAWKTDYIVNCLLQNGFKRIDFYAFNTRNKPNDNDERIQFVAYK